MQSSWRARKSHEGSRRVSWWWRWERGGQLAEHLAGIWDDERESQETQWPTSSRFSAFNVSLGHQRNGDTWLPSPNGSHMRSEGGWGDQFGEELLRPLPLHFLSVTFSICISSSSFFSFSFFIYILCVTICRKSLVLCKFFESAALGWTKVREFKVLTFIFRL